MEDRIGAIGVALGSAPLPYRLDYTLETRAEFVSENLVVSVRGDGWKRTLNLHQTHSGSWKASYEEEGVRQVPLQRIVTDASGLAGALDVDLGLSPLFNTMPVIRHGLNRHGRFDFIMAWVSVPDLTVHRSPQRYSFVRALDQGLSVVRFESLAGDGFVADLTYDAEGFVIDYPGIGRRIGLLDGASTTPSS